MTKVIPVLLALSCIVSADFALAQTKLPASAEKKAKPAVVEKKTTSGAANAAKGGSHVAGNKASKRVDSIKAGKQITGYKTVVRKKKMQKIATTGKNAVTHEQETVEIDNKNSTAVVEINGGDVFVNGDLISTVESPKNEKHKIVIRFRDEQAERREVYKDDETIADHNRRPMLGVYSDKNAEQGGAYVSSVVRNSPAADAGLLPGDVITKINNRDIRSASDLVDAVSDHTPGETIHITYSRQGKDYHTEADLAETTTFRRHETFRYQVPDLHGNRRFPTPFLHSYLFNSNDKSYEHGPQMGIEGQDASNGKGVLVVNVKKNSAADIAGLEAGDLIIRLDHQRVTTVDDIADILNDTWPNQKITVEFKRDGVVMFAYMRFTKDRIKRDL